MLMSMVVRASWKLNANGPWVVDGPRFCSPRWCHLALNVTGLLVYVKPQFALVGMKRLKSAVRLPLSFSLVALAKRLKLRPQVPKRPSDWRTLNSAPETRASPALIVEFSRHPA